MYREQTVEHRETINLVKGEKESVVKVPLSRLKHEDYPRIQLITLMR